MVDDDHDVADSLALLLGTWNHEVRIAHDGVKALDEMAGFQPDAVLLDLGLPGIDGFETAQRMRATPAGGHVALVALSGWGREEDISRTNEAGFDRHLVKPVEPGVLEQLLAQL